MARRVLITGVRAAAGLDLARDFVAAGWEVHLAESVTVRMARWSSLPARHHRYPPPRQEPAGFRAAIVKLVKAHAIDLVVPVCEEVFHLAAPSLHAALDSRLFAPDLTLLRTLHDKLLFAQAAQALGLPVPESRAVNDVSELADYAADGRDWVFKRRFTRFGGATLMSPDSAQLAAIHPDSADPWLAQARVRGTEVCFQAVAHKGHLVGFAAYGSRWRLPGGASYAFDPLDQERSERLRALAASLAAGLAIHGQFGCDGIFDDSGQPKLIECNPRATSGVHLLAGGGHLARAMADGVTMPHGTPTPAYLAPAMLVMGLPRALRAGRLAEWRATLAAGRDAVTRRGDRLPFLGAIVDGGIFALTGLRRAIPTNAATTHDIEWNGEELD